MASSSLDGLSSWCQRSPPTLSTLWEAQQASFKVPSQACSLEEATEHCVELAIRHQLENLSTGLSKLAFEPWQVLMPNFMYNGVYNDNQRSRSNPRHSARHPCPIVNIICLSRGRTTEAQSMNAWLGCFVYWWDGDLLPLLCASAITCHCFLFKAHRPLAYKPLLLHAIGNACLICALFCLSPTAFSTLSPRLTQRWRMLCTLPLSPADLGVAERALGPTNDRAGLC